MINANLTYLDSLYLLHAPQLVIAPIVFLAVSFALIWYRHVRLGRRLSFREIADFTFPFASWKTRSAVFDAVLYVLNKVIMQVNKLIPLLAGGAIIIGAIALAEGSLFAAVPDAQKAQLHSLDIALILFLSFLFLDLGDYLAHLAMHKSKVLWELHQVHHSATFLSPITSYRAHPFESYVYTFFHTLTLLPLFALVRYFYAISWDEITAILVLTAAISGVVSLQYLKHSHFQISFGPLDYLLISPHMHQLHHSTKPEHWDKNLGITFALWDWIFRTGVRQDTSIPVTYGLGKGEKYDAQYLSLYGAYVMPFVNIWRMVRGAGRGTPAAPSTEGLVV